MGIEYRSDPRKLEEVAEKLISSLRNREGIFQKNDLIPELINPQGIEPGSLEHSLYIFYGAALDSLRGSQKVWNAARKMAEAGLKDIAKKPEDARFMLSTYLDEGIHDPVSILLKNAEKLDAEYDGDPRNILNRVRDFDTAQEIVSKFPGIGKQKASLLIKNLVRFFYASVQHIVPKIDRHMTRMALGTGIVKLYQDGIQMSMENMNEKVKPRIVHLGTTKNMVYRATGMLGLPITKAIDFDDAKYVIGSRVCVQSRYTKCKELCPLDCTMLVRTTEHVTYAIIPSERRNMQYKLL
ncbi:MAG: hypothetical protein ABIF10_03545 [Candidatus Woesearchaeota archaeon]